MTKSNIKKSVMTSFQWRPRHYDVVAMTNKHKSAEAKTEHFTVVI